MSLFTSIMSYLFNRLAPSKSDVATAIVSAEAGLAVAGAVAAAVPVASGLATPVATAAAVVADVAADLPAVEALGAAVKAQVGA